MNKEKIIQYATGNIRSDDEKNEILQYLAINEEAREFYYSEKNTWALTKEGDKEADLVMEYKKLSGKIFKPRDISFHTAFRYAAILVLAVGLSCIWLIFKESPIPISMNKVICPEGQIAEVVLSDGTHVWLNSESSIAYPSSFNGEDRRVELIGEAYFDVEKNEDNLFQVKVKEMQIKVLGTSFNINAYPENDYIETTLVEGKIELLNETGDKILDLQPGQKACYDSSLGKLLLSEVDTNFYSSWKDGKISFFNERLELIIARLERWYNVEFVIKHTEINDYRFSGTIVKDKPLLQVLEIIKLSSAIDFQIIQKKEGKNLIILSKKKKMPMENKI